jgi:GAF domain-containing protein
MPANQPLSSNSPSHSRARGRARELKIERRSVRPNTARGEPNPERETLGLRQIAQNAGDEPYAVLQGLLTAALELCGGGAQTSTAGVSLLEPTPEGGQQFRWVALAGCLAAHVGGTTPRDFSPCGVCLDRNGPVLFARPDLKYTYFQAAGLEFTEGLVVPFTSSSHPSPLGTIWVVSHPPARHHFDAEDVRLMKSLGSFAASAYSLAVARDSADSTMRQNQDVVAEMSQEMRTQLNTIAGFVDLLTLGVKGGLNEGQAEYIGRIKKAVSLLLAGVNGLSPRSRFM